MNPEASPTAPPHPHPLPPVGEGAAPTTIEIELEDRRQALPAGSTVADLIAALQLPAQGTTVAVDGEHVPRAQWLSHPLADGQRVLFFKPIVGG